MMQATQVQEEAGTWWGTLGLLLLLGVAVLVTGVVMSQMGLGASRFGAHTAVPAGAYHITAADMRFGQETLRVQAGEAVTLALDNKDVLPHSWDVAELDLHVAMPAHGRVVFTFTPTEPGTYLVYCAVPGHQEAGMVSTLIVE